MSPASARFLDGSALGLSSLCIVHCLLLPVAAALLPLAGALAEAEWVHVLFAAAAVPIAGLAFLRRTPEGRAPAGLMALAAGGVGLLVAGLAVPHEWEGPVTVAGGLFLAAAHGLNWRRRHRARACPG